VALPTETVYGLAANALDPQAVARIYAAKGRPAHNPIIVHVAGVEMAMQCVADWPIAAKRLAEAFWPGPLTMVLPRAAAIPDVVTAGGSTVGVRWPSHPFMQAVIRECGFPLAAPSANRANELSPTNALHVAKSLGDQLDLIVDGGQSQVGIESTVVDLTTVPPKLLRPGMIHDTALGAVIQALAPHADGPPSGGSEPLRSPGQLPKHYAPRARMVTWSWGSDEELAGRLAGEIRSGRRVHVVSHTGVPTRLPSTVQVSVIPHDPEAFARALYAELHRCDEELADLIVVEAVPESTDWRGIADRLARASA
jgi:L-threonylcarbamoyladenylate synthase